MCVAEWLGAARQIFYPSQICEGALQHYCLLTVAGLLYSLHISQYLVFTPKSQLLNSSFQKIVGSFSLQEGWRCEQMYAKSQKSVINPEKQSEKALSSWHVMGISTNAWRSVTWKLWGSGRGVWYFILCISLFHHLPTKTLAVLDSPCNDVTIKQMIAMWLQAVLGILGKAGYKEHARRKRHLLLLLQCSLCWLWGEEQDLVWSFEQVNNWDLLSFIGRLSWSRRKNNP